MKNKKLTVTIGIPAYNEEANIGYLLKSLIEQKEEDFRIDKIIVSSDGSTDKTVEIVKSVKDSRIKLLDNKKRRGQASRQNQIVRQTTNDVLVLLEADTLPVDRTYIKNLVEPLTQDSSVGLVFGQSVALPPRNFFEKIMYFKSSLKEEIFHTIKDGNNLNKCGGHRGRAFSKKFAKKLYWPGAVPEDTFSFLMCQKLGFKIKYARNTNIYHRLPGNIKDYLKQYSKYSKARTALKKYFPAEELKSKYKYFSPQALEMVVKGIVKNPLLMFSYVIVLTLVKILNINKGINFNPFLEIHKSSKTLVVHLNKQHKY